MKPSDRDIRLNRTIVCLAVVAVLLVLPFGNVPAAFSAPLASTINVSPVVGFEGYLADDGAGGNVADGQHPLTFTIWDAETGGTDLWHETQMTVTVTGGLYSVALGDVNPLTNGNPLSPSGLGKRWIGVKVGNNQEIFPRTRVTSAPFALNADHANNAETAPWGGITGIPAGFADGIDNSTAYTAGTGITIAADTISLGSAFRLPQTCANGQVARSTGSGLDWACLGSVVSGTAASGQLTWWNSAGTITGNSGLTYNGSTLTITGGVNLGNATGAVAGQLKQSTSSQVWGSSTLTAAASGTLPVGTGSANAVAAWSNTNALTGSSGLTWDGTLLKLNNSSSKKIQFTGSNGTTVLGEISAYDSVLKGLTIQGTGSDNVIDLGTTQYPGVHGLYVGSGSTTMNPGDVKLSGGIDVGAATTGAGAGDVKASGNGTFAGGLNIGGASGAAVGDVKAGGNGTFSGGLNINTSGATTGTIRTAGRIYPSNQAGVGYAANVQTIANLGVAQICDVPATTGLIVVIDVSSGNTAMYMLRGGLHTTVEVSDPDNHFTPGKNGATSINVYWDTTNARYEIQNTTGGPHAIYMYILAV